MKASQYSILGLSALCLTASLSACSSKYRSDGKDTNPTTGGTSGGSTSGSLGGSSSGGSSSGGSSSAGTTSNVGGGSGGSSSGGVGGTPPNVGGGSSLGGTEATSGGGTEAAGGTSAGSAGEGGANGGASTTTGTGGGGTGGGGTAGTGGGGTAGTGGTLIIKCTEGEAFCECDDVGCFVTVGGPCTESGDCLTQECGVTQEATNVCCAEDCGAEEVCSADGTTCEIANPCPIGDFRCNGDYEECVAGEWELEDACDGLGCDLAIGGCKLDTGDACANDNECGVGTCQDTASGGRVCCASSCGVCQMCDDTGTGCATPTTIPDGCECTPSDTSQCADAHACTNDICVDESCQNPVATGCLIAGECISEGAREPGNPCRQCNSALNTTGWSNVSNGTSCDDGLWCNGDGDLCDGLGTCSHTYPTGNRCAGSTGACAVQTCSESKQNCFRNAGYVCDTDTYTGCLNGSACSSEVWSWPVEYTCSGTSANCGTTPIEKTGEAVVSENCGSDEACYSPTSECRPKLGCDTSFCQDGYCWTTDNAPTTYAQDPARAYCGDLTLGGLPAGAWRLPTFEDYERIIEGPNGECYWPVEMGSCEQPDPPGGFYEYWTNESAITFAPWVGTSGFWPPDALLYVRCVATQ